MAASHWGGGSGAAGWRHACKNAAILRVCVRASWSASPVSHAPCACFISQFFFMFHARVVPPAQPSRAHPCLPPPCLALRLAPDHRLSTAMPCALRLVPGLFENLALQRHPIRLLTFWVASGHCCTLGRACIGAEVACCLLSQLLFLLRVHALELPPTQPQAREGEEEAEGASSKPPSDSHTADSSAGTRRRRKS